MLEEQHGQKAQDLELVTIRKFAKEVMITCKPDGTVSAWNPAAERMFGYGADEMIGKAIAVVIPPDKRSHELAIFDRARRGERTEDYETRRIDRNGKSLHISAAFLPILDEIGQVLAILTIAVDLSDRKRLEEAEHARLFLSAIVSSADDAIVTKTLDGIVTSWNQAAERLFGYASAEMVGKPISTLVPADQPSEEPRILERIRRGERIEHYETRRLRKDGQIIDVSVSISPIRDEMGRIIGASKIARDVTERKRWQQAEAAESFLGALVSSAHDAIISKSLDGIITSWNAAAEKLFGYSAAEMIGKPLTLLIPADHADEEPEILRRIRRGERIEHYEAIRRRKDGTTFHVSQTISPIRDSLGRIIGVSNITHDITDQKNADTRERTALFQAQEARKQAEQASRAKDDFLATISHELRTPMTAILGWGRILMSRNLDPDTQRKAIDTIDRNARSQAQLIEDLLDISRIVSGRLRVEFKAVDLASVISAAIEATRLAAEAKQIRVQTVIGSGAGPILGDAERLQQVVWNLIANAIRFTPKNGSIQIELERVESQVTLRVSDNGSGIHPDFIPRLFDRFSQSDSSITRSGSGLGMGLAIVKSLVELHGGVVTVSSPGEGKGATFAVKLPVCAIRQEERLVPELENTKLVDWLSERNELVGLKVLVVDDEPDARAMLNFILNKAGAIVETAASADECLQLMNLSPPDILISDIGMPGVDGYELIRILREERNSRVPAVALTAMARIEDRVKTLTAGYQMHVAKPVDPAELLTIVGSVVSLVTRRPIENAG